ncbi:MAG: hypothetical protein ACREIC_31185, partial [Limisphaerales bacterium]
PHASFGSMSNYFFCDDLDRELNFPSRAREDAMNLKLQAPETVYTTIRDNNNWNLRIPRRGWRVTIPGLENFDTHVIRDHAVRDNFLVADGDWIVINPTTGLSLMRAARFKTRAGAVNECTALVRDYDFRHGEGTTARLLQSKIDELKLRPKPKLKLKLKPKLKLRK